MPTRIPRLRIAAAVLCAALACTAMAAASGFFAGSSGRGGGKRASGARPVDLVRALSPDGKRAYVVHYLIARGPRVPPTHGTDDLELRVRDRATGRLEPRPVPVSGDGEGRLSGTVVDDARSRDGRWSYTLFYGDRHELYLLALDTTRGRAQRIDLPQPRRRSESYALRLRRADDGRRLDVLGPIDFSQRLPVADAQPLLEIDARTLGVRGRLAREQRRRSDFLAFTRTPPRLPGNYVARFGRVGRSVEGRPIALKQYGDPAWPGELLVFGCIHGDECAARHLEPLGEGGCPDPSADVLVVPDLDPDGSAAGTRLNGRGVDLNRNFPAQWRPLGRRGDPQHSGPGPASEPETRLAMRIVRALEPAATVWFHQHAGPGAFVRAWGHSVPAARRFARLAGIPFLLLPWPAGTAPNWQNRRYGGAAAFVVELPSGELRTALGARLSHALVRLGRWVRED